MRLKRWAPIVLALLALYPFGVAPAGAQGVTTGSIRGQVLSSEGAPVANAQVIATNPETGLTRGALSDAQGRYAILLLPSGSYTVRASIVGFAEARLANVTVRTGETTPLTVRLVPQTLALEALTVTGERAASTTRAQGGVVSRVRTEQLENLPVQGRDFTDFLNLSPLVSPQPQVGTGGQFSIGGARTSGTNIQIDGADANNVYFGENRGSSRTPFAFSLESVKEFQLITNGFDVEYGNYQGGVMNAVTKGGTNRFQGTVFYYRRDEALTGNDFLDSPPADFKVHQFGVSASGPIARDRLHFFVSADGQKRDQPFFAGDPRVGALNPDSVNAFLQILQARYGVADPQQYYGRYLQGQDNLALFGRLDWTINAAHRLTVRQSYSDFEQTNDRIGTTEAQLSGGPFKDRVYSTVAELNSVFGNTFNTLRLQYSDEDRPRLPNPGGYIPEVSVALQTGQTIRFGGDGIIFRNRLQERKLQLIDNLTLRQGDHTFKLGTNNILANAENTFWLNGNGSYFFSSLNNFRNGVASNYRRSMRACPVPLIANRNGEQVICPEYDVPVSGFDVLEWSVYAQDEWQATEKLQVTAGLRYGGTSFRDEPLRVDTLERTLGVATGVVPDFSGLSPRLSFMYDATDAHALRGGVGLLIGRTPLVLAGNVFQTEKLFRQLECTGAGIPRLDVGEWLSSPDGQLNPAGCAGGATARQGVPEFSVFSRGFELPRTLKANLGYEGVLPSGTRFSADVIFSDTRRNFTVLDANLRDSVFTLTSEAGRPVYVPAARLGGGFTSTRQADRSRNVGFDRVYVNTSDGEARAWNLNFEVDQNLGAVLQVGLRYGYNRASDNGSFSCCTSNEGFTGTPTAGNPNFYGNPGDAERGTWAPSDFERRHVLVANFLWRAPLGFRLNGIFRSQSGTPWTPVVDGDVNGDGARFNDRAFVSRALQFNSPADAARFQSVLADFDCIREQEGEIARRNSCRNPGWNSLDLRLSKEVRTFGAQRLELLVDVFNVLNGLNEDWGRYVTVATSSTNLLKAERYDATTGQIVYSVNYDPAAEAGQRGFGEARPLPFGDPFQFQVQLGARYRF